MRPLAAAVCALLLAGCAAPDGPAPGPSSPSAWVALASLEVERTESAAVAAAGKVWVIGGIFDTSEAQQVGRVDVFDPATGTWSAGPPLPHPLHHTLAVAVGDVIYVVGGYTGVASFVARSESYRLDASLAGAAWEPWVALPAARGGHAGATDGRSIFVVGGVGAPGPVVYVPGVQNLLERTAWRIDTQASSPAWTAMAALPDPRDHLGAALVDGKLYAVGGRDVFLNANTGRLDVYDPASDAWSRGADMPTARGGIGAQAVGGKLVVVGGEETQRAFARTEVYDPASDAWVEGPDLPAPRHGVASAQLGGAMHVLTGGEEPGFDYSGSHYVWTPS